MAGSLFDQMMKAGLVDKNKAKKVKKEKYQQTKQQKKKKGQTVVSEAAVLAEKTKQEKADKAQALNLQRKQAQETKALQAEVLQIIASNQLKGYTGSESFDFVDGTTVKTLKLKPTIKTALIAGRIHIAHFKGGYALLPDEAAEKIKQRDASVLVSLAEKEDTSLSDEDKDYYAQFEIPDDLTW